MKQTLSVFASISHKKKIKEVKKWSQEKLIGNHPEN
jgi:hypothetical protein